MKLLTTIAAVLISISAFSQDYIEYDNGIFTQNGEQLSMGQIKDLTVLHKAGSGNFWRGLEFDSMHDNIYLRGTNNTLNFIGGAATGFVGSFTALLGSLSYASYGPRYTQDWVYIGVPAGAGLCVVSFKAFSRIVLSKKGCLKRRDEKFNKVAYRLNQKVADKLNEAIKAAVQ